MPFVPMVAERCVNLADFRVITVAKLCFQLNISVVVAVKAEHKGKTVTLRISVAGISKQRTHLWFHMHKQIFFLAHVHHSLHEFSIHTQKY